jgi:integrase/recombinase XerD
MSALAPTLQAFFTERLIDQRHASPNTIAAYRDTLKLLLAFAAKQLHRQPCELDLGDLDAQLIAAFLTHLENERGNSVKTRNARLAAIHSLYRYAALRHPEHAEDIQRVLAIPPKRSDRALVTFLDRTEIDALLAAPDRSTWTGRRDHTLLLTAIQTGLRASELTGLNCGDAHLATGAHLSCRGKGRKQRITPLTAVTVAVLRVWLTERDGESSSPLFPTARGRRLSRDGLERRLTKHLGTAAELCPTLRNKKVTLHTLRHTAAMQLLHAGVDTTVIALWLGHERVDTTQIYLHADLALKERALARTKPPDAKPGRYRPPDALLAFLEAL